MIHFTKLENLSTSEKITKNLESWDKSKKYPLAGKITARTVGPLAVFLSSAVDAVAHAVFALIKAPIALVLSPYHFITFCFIPGKKLHKDLQLLSVCKHLFRVAESVFFAATLPLLTLINPEKAHALASWRNKLSKIEELQQEIDEKNKEIHKKNDQMGLLEKELNNAHRTEQEIQQLYGDNSAVIKGQIQEIQKLKNQISSNEKNIHQLTANRNREIEGKNLQISNLENQMVHLNAQIKHLQNSLKTNQQQLQQKQSEIDNLHDASQGKNKNFNELQGEVQKLKENEVAYNNKLTQLTNNLHQLNNEKLQIIHEKKQTETNLENLQKENTYLKTTVLPKIELGLKNLQSQLKKEGEQLQRANEANQQLNKQLGSERINNAKTIRELTENKNKEIEEKNQQLHKLNSHIGSLNSEINNLRSSLVKNQQLIQQKQSEINNLQNIPNGKLKELQEEILELRKHKATYDNMLLQLNNELQKLMNEKNQIANEKLQLTNELKSVKNENLLLENIAQDLRIEIEMNEIEGENKLKIAIEENQKLHDQLKTEQTKHAKEIRNKDLKNFDLRNQLTDLPELKKTNQEQKEKITGLQKVIHTAGTEVKKLQQEIEQLKEEVKENQKTITLLKRNAENDLEMIQKQNQQITQMEMLRHNEISRKNELLDQSPEGMSYIDPYATPTNGTIDPNGLDDNLDDKLTEDECKNALERIQTSIRYPEINFRMPLRYDFPEKEQGKTGKKNIMGEVWFETKKIPTVLAVYSGDVLVPDPDKEHLPLFYLNPVNRDNRGATKTNPEMPGGMADIFLNHHMDEEAKVSYEKAVVEFYEKYNKNKDSNYGYAEDKSKRALGVRANKTPLWGAVKQKIDERFLNKKIIPLLDVNETLFAKGKKDYYCCISGPRGGDKYRESLITETAKVFVLDCAKKASEDGVKELLLQAPIPSSGIFKYDPKDSLPFIFNGFKEAIAELETKNYEFSCIKISLFAWNDEKNPNVSETLLSKFLEAFKK